MRMTSWSKVVFVVTAIPVLDSYSDLIFRFEEIMRTKEGIYLGQTAVRLVLCDSNLPPRLCQALLRKMLVEKL